MKPFAIVLPILLACVPSHAAEPLLRDFGTTTEAKSGTRIELTKIKDDALGVKVTFVSEGRESTTGTSTSGMPVKPGQWAVQFRPPSEIWVYDGRSVLHLYEKTDLGFRAVSSTSVPDLWKKAPPELLQFTTGKPAPVPAPEVK
ncbi:hypothetical protein KBB96_00430 [Luteolibacter ambystomatis]|uniref:Uncharacterized protein n=1 Tax=Luteolibacter ambystomatis TaxID=2824561 RepID=A0A975G9U3_9BACT|nr:hypothetical protein [Luteolibacter ambystomatis]QUE51380.1 hypothetical protein KBB96_00430 [Luteolibacter ambystomatis]